MSMYPEPHFDVPELTAKIAQANFPKGNKYVKMRDESGTIYKDEQFVDLYPQVGQSAIPPAGNNHTICRTVNRSRCG